MRVVDVDVDVVGAGLGVVVGVVVGVASYPDCPWAYKWLVATCTLERAQSACRAVKA